MQSTWRRNVVHLGPRPRETEAKAAILLPRMLTRDGWWLVDELPPADVLDSSLQTASQQGPGNDH